MISKRDRALLSLKLQAKAKLAADPVNYESAACDLSNKVQYTGTLIMEELDKVIHAYGKEVDFLVQMPDYWVVYSIDEEGEGSIVAAYDQIKAVAEELGAEGEYRDDDGYDVHTKDSLVAAFERRVWDIYLPGAIGVWYRSW